MTDTLELIDLEELVGAISVPCDECEKEDPNEAKWQVNHGNPGCVYLICDWHLMKLKEFLSQHPECGHKHIHCNVCDEMFGKHDASWCPFSTKGN